MVDMTFADVLLVPGQGSYETGGYFSEYPDGDVYLGHAIAVKDIVQSWKYSHVVCSGGRTQKGKRTLSEARSFQTMWTDTNSWPLQRDRIFYDELALDSAENVLLGLMEARQQLGEVPIRRIGVFAAWKFKKQRFNRLAREMGMLPRFYFHGFAGADAADAGQKALQGELDQLGVLAIDSDPLLLHARWESKRRARFVGDLPIGGKEGEDRALERDSSYAARLDGLKQSYPGTFAALDAIQQSIMKAVKPNYDHLKAAFASEIVLGRSS